MPRKVNLRHQKHITRRSKERRREIDALFNSMTKDREYQRETLQIMQEFAESDAEALRICEQDDRQKSED